MTDTKTVPCEPTEAMWEAARQAWRNHERPYTFDCTKAAFRAMLAAAPAHQPDRQGAGEPVPVVWLGKNGDYTPRENMVEAALEHMSRAVSEERIVRSFMEMMHQAEIDGLVAAPSAQAAPPPPADTAMREAQELAIIGLYLSEGRSRRTTDDGDLSIDWDFGDRQALIADAEAWALEEEPAKYRTILATLSRQDAAEGRG